MALKDLLVHVDQSPAGRHRLCLAAGLAARHNARLTALHVREYSLAQQHRLAAAELGLMPGHQSAELARGIEHELDRDIAELRALFDQLTQGSAVAARWRAVSGHASKLITQEARTADLTVVGHGSEDSVDLPDDYSFAEAMLFGSGRPLLIVPSQGEAAQPVVGAQVAVAWNGSRPAARALADALPLIERAERVVVLVADKDAQAVMPAMEAVLDNLALHNADVQAVAVPLQGREIADALQSEALSLGVDLLVAGAYGHPRLWEKMLGGTTHDMLARTRMPLLMAH